MYTYLKIRMFLDTDEYDNIHHHLRNILLSKNAQAIMKKRTKMIVYDTVFNNNDREKELVDNVDYILDYQNKAFHEHEKKYGNTKRFFMNFRLDTANDECLSMLEKLIFENVKRCMKELDNEFDEKVHTIEYWLNNKYYSIHVDCDSELYQNTNGEILRQGIHNGIIYMDDNYEPTFISEFTREDRDLNTVQRMDSAFVLSFPKKFRCIAFDGRNYHGAISYDKHQKEKRIVVAYNVWVKESCPNTNESILSTNNTNPIKKDDFALIDNNNYFENIVFSPLNYAEIFEKDTTNELHQYIDYVIHQHERNKVDLNTAGIYIFASPLSRYSLVDEMGTICFEIKNLNNDAKAVDDVILWKKYTYKDIIPHEICDKIIKSCEEIAGNETWPLMHSAYKSSSISLDSLDIFNQFMSDVFEKNIIPAIEESYKYNFSWNIRDIFINKYDCAHNANGLSPHKDGSHITLNIALNDKSEYENGGTKFIDDNEVISLDKGEMLIHCGKELHTGVQITKGTRYVMVIFMDFVFSV